MSGRIAVTKMQGAQNDFVILDGRTQRVRDLSDFAHWVCDRRIGVGADGLLVVEESQVADARMRTINADGSEAEMCGNGIRCVVRYLDELGEHGHHLETLAGIYESTITSRDPEFLVRANLGTPRLERRPMPLTDAQYVDTGNPHVVIFVPELEGFDLETAAAPLQHDPNLPGGVNVHALVVKDPHRIEVRHWERGVGMTMACGTGAVACAAAAIGRDLARSPVEVYVPGGRLVVEWRGVGDAFMTGPAVRVFDAILCVPN